MSTSYTRVADNTAVSDTNDPQYSQAVSMAGANAVEVGTATFYEPAAPARVLAELRQWCARHRISTLDELIGAAHG